MKKREFVAAALATAVCPASAQSSDAVRPSGAPVLTISGDIAKPNRPAFDATIDVLMAKHGVAFSRAYVLGWTTLAAMPARTIRPTLEYDRKRHALRGPLLTDVLDAAGVRSADSTFLGLRAVDGYAPEISLKDARAYRFIIATHRDDQPLALGGLGPLWAIYDADSFPDRAQKPVEQRFADCPWGLYHIAVRTK